MRTAMMAGQIGSAELADLVAREATLDYSFPVASLARLAALAPTAPAPAVTEAGLVRLHAGFHFRAGAEGYPQLHLVVTGTVPVVCQRCLDFLAMPVSIDVLLTIVRNDQEAGVLADPFDTVLLADGELVPEQVVEDEVLAALPLVPKHGDTTPCGSGAGREDRLESGEMHRPMAGLADLLGRSDRQGDK
jgi:Large ribosomal RNA subunit accumulation protein YceD